MPRKVPSISVGSPRKRTTVDPDAAAEFEARAEEEGRATLKAVPKPQAEPVSSESVNPEPTNPKQEASAKSHANRKGTVQTPYVRKSDGVATVALTFTVPAALARKVKVHAAMTGTKTSEIGVEALTRYLETQKS